MSAQTAFTELEVLPLEKSDLAESGRIFRGAMSADFVFHNIYPPPRQVDEEEYVRLYTAEAEEGFDEAIGKGLKWMKAVEKGSTTPLGFAKWIPPTAYARAHQEELAKKDKPEEAKKPKSAAKLALEEIEDVPFTEGFFKGIQGKRKERFPEGKPHWYLALLVVSPNHQRKGVGQALVRWGVDQAEAEGVPCYLEASPFGKGLYIKHGFGIVGHLVVPGKYTVPGYAHAKQLEDVDGEERWESHMPLMYRPAPGEAAPQAVAS